jgi:hypothetical protein
VLIPLWLAPTLSSITPDAWSKSGTVVTIVGAALGNNDVVVIKIANQLVRTFTWVSSTKVLAIAPSVTTATSGQVMVNVSSSVTGAVGLMFSYLAGAAHFWLTRVSFSPLGVKVRPSAPSCPPAALRRAARR